MNRRGNLRGWGAAALLLGAFACRDLTLSQTAMDLALAPDELVVAQAWVGHATAALLTLQNRGRAPLDVALAVDAPFTVPASVHVPAGETVTVQVSLTPARLGRVDGVLRARWLDAQRDVPVRAQALAAPRCEAAECRGSRFDPHTGACVEAPTPDGEACGAGNACLLGGTCRAGQCVGATRDCDDGNACSADACLPEQGCVHLDASASCPAPEGACQAATCDPQTGCGVAPAVDGTPCGPNDCATAHVCIAGACVTRAAPEGSQCAPPTACRGPGVCRANGCELPPPAPLAPVWRYQPPPGHELTFLGTVDDDGNLYATEHWVEDDSETDTHVTALVKLSFHGRVEYAHPVVLDCPNCRWGLALAVDSANRRVFFNALGVTRAHSTVDGRPLWARDVTAGLPAYDVRPDGGGAFYTSAPLLLGGDQVAVSVSEGQSDHHAYVRVLERGSGAHTWQFHRKGHLYGTGASGDGQLWTSSANCWARAGEMARVTPAGQVAAARFIELIPQAYGQDFALGTGVALTQRVDQALATRGVGIAGVTLTAGDRVVTWQSGELLATSLTTGVGLWRHRGVSGSSPSFELLRDGGVAWTAGVIDGGVLGAVDATGAELLVCPLSTTVESATAIIRGRAFVQAQGGVVAYDVPGLDVEPHGWVSYRGSLERGGRAR